MYSLVPSSPYKMPHVIFLPLGLVFLPCQWYHHGSVFQFQFLRWLEQWNRRYALWSLQLPDRHSYQGPWPWQHQRLLHLPENNFELKPKYSDKNYLWWSWERNLNTTTFGRDFINEFSSSGSKVFVILLWYNNFLLLNWSQFSNLLIKNCLCLFHTGFSSQNGNNILFIIICP